MLFAFIILLRVDLNKYYNKKEEIKNDNSTLNKVLNIIKKDEITQNYLVYHLTGSISYACLNGMLITLLTANLGFSASSASNFKMILGIVAVFVGTLVLEKLTFKNDYINFLLKYGGRLILYLMAFIFNNKLIFLVAIIFMRLLAESYSHISEAPYVNRFSSNNQLAFCNLREMIGYFSKAIGNFLCGISIAMGTRYSFLFAFVFIIFQVIFGVNALRLRLKENEVVNL